MKILTFQKIQNGRWRPSWITKNAHWGLLGDYNIIVYTSSTQISNIRSVISKNAFQSMQTCQLGGHLESAAILNHLQSFFSLPLFINRFVIWKSIYVPIFSKLISKLPPQLNFQFGNLSNRARVINTDPVLENIFLPCTNLIQR